MLRLASEFAREDAAVVLIVIVSEVADAAVNVQLDSEGSPAQLKVGVATPPSSPRLIVPEPLCPGAETVMFKVLGPIVKS